jgi:titin
VAGSGLTGEYFLGNGFQAPVLLRNDADVDFLWSSGRPDPTFLHRAFSVRWTGQIDPPLSQTYTIYVQCRGGAQVWINDELVIDAATNHGPAEFSGTAALSAGQKYSVRIDYTAAGTGAAEARLLWSSPGHAREVIPQSALFPDPGATLPIGAGITGEYFQGNNFQKLVATRIDPKVDFQWFGGTPTGSVAGRPFTIRWVGSIEPKYSETYTFHTRGNDDGVRLWVDGQPIIQKWVDGSYVEKGTISLQAGVQYSIQLDHLVDDKYDAAMKLEWSSPSQVREVVPTQALSTAVIQAVSGVNGGDSGGGPVRGTIGTLNVTTPAPGQIVLNWVRPGGVTGFTIERSVNGTADWTQVGTTPPGVMSYTDTALTAGQTYFYYVVPTGQAPLAGSPTNAVSATATLNPLQVFSSSVSPTEVAVSWGREPGASAYNVQRSTDGTKFVDVGSAGASTTTFTDSGLNAGTNYTYRVIADTSGGPAVSEYTATATTAVAAAPVAPAVTSVSASRISLGWASSPGAAGYSVFRSLDGISGWTQVSSVTAPQTTFVDDSVSAGTTYYYQIAATSPAGNSPPSAVVVDTTAPSSPTNVIAIARSASAVAVSWAGGAEATGFTIMASSDGGAHYLPVGAAAAEATGYEVTGLSAGTAYLFQVFARNAAGPSAPAGPAAATTAPAAPASVTAAAVSSGQIDVAWAPSAGATGYDVQRSTDGISFLGLAPASAEVTSYADDTTAAATRYWYRIVATNAGGSSITSTAADATTAASSPLGLVARTTSDTRIDLSWGPLPHASGYAVGVSTDGTTFTDLGTPAAGTDAYAATGLMPGTAYWFRVAASTTNEAPTNVAAVAASAGEVMVSWSFVTGAQGYVVERSLDGATGWASVGSTTAGTTQFTDSSVAAGTSYYYRVLATDAGGNSAPSAVAAATTPPQSPVLSAAAFSSSEIDLTWSDTNGETGFQVLASGNGGVSFQSVGSVGQGITTFKATALSAATAYWFKVQATDSGGTSVSSNACGSTTLAAAPANASAAAASANQINLTWDDVAGETGFVVERSSDGSTGWTQVGSTGAGVATFSDTGLLPGTTYFYREVAVDAGGDSAPGPVVSATTAPEAPANVVISAGDAPGDVSWDAAPGATGYIVQRSTDGTTFGDVGTTTTPAFSDRGQSPGTTYFYRVVATVPGAESLPSVAATVTTPALPPTSVAATADSSSQTTVTWAPVIGATGYLLQRSSEGASGWTTVGTTVSATSYGDTGLPAATTLYYQVVSVDGGGDSAPSGVASVTTAPEVPANVALGVGGNPGAITWDATPGATGYTVERSTDGTTFTDVGATTSPAFTDSGQSAATTYYYRVIATVSGADSLPSVAVSVTTPTAAPSGVEATADSSSQTTVTWSPVAGATSYLVQRSSDGSTGWTTIGTTTSATSINDSGLAAGTPMYYQVVAVDSGGESAPSGVVSVTTAPNPPGNVAVDISGNPERVTWNAAPGATGYIVQRSTDDASFANVGATITPGFTDSGQAAATTYYYRVIATLPGAQSLPSVGVSVTTPTSAPVGTVAAAGSSASQTTVAWGPVSGATGYLVQRSIDGSTGWATVGTTTNTTTFTDTGLPAGTTFYYQVVALSPGGDSAPSAAISATTLPATPTHLTATAISDTQINLSWQDVPGETGFVIERAPAGSTSFAPIGIVGPGTTVFDNAGLTPGTPYSYTVVAVNGSGTSVPSSAAAASTTDSTPAYAAETAVYGLSSTLGEVYWINTTTAASTRIGTMLFGTAACGRDPVSGNFYYVEQNTRTPRIGVWDPTTDTNRVIGIAKVSGLVLRAAFTSDGAFYITSSNSDLYTISTTTGAASADGTITWNGSALPSAAGDMAFAPDGSLYLESNGTLYNVNLPSLAARQIGSDGRAGSLQVAFGQDGVLYGTDAGGNLYSVSLSSGAAKLIGNTGVPTIGDLASVPLEADLSVAQSGSTFTRGADGTFTLLVSNAGPNGTNAPITVTDTLATGLSYVSAAGDGWSVNVSGQSVTLNYGAPVPANASPPRVVLTMAVSPTAASTVSNSVNVSTSIFDRSLGNNDSTINAAVV